MNLNSMIIDTYLRPKDHEFKSPIPMYVYLSSSGDCVTTTVEHECVTTTTEHLRIIFIDNYITNHLSFCSVLKRNIKKKSPIETSQKGKRNTCKKKI